MFLPCLKRKNGVICLASRRIRTSTKYQININFLDHGIVSHQHAWFWGLFLTDGSIASTGGKNHFIRCGGLSWQQKYDSYSMLKALRNIVSSNHTIVFDSQPGGKCPHCKLNLCSVRLATAAQNLLGCPASRKTYDLGFPSIEPEFLSSLVRGIVDGDGSWGFNNTKKYPIMVFSIVSANELFLQRIRDVINTNCLNTVESAGKIYVNNNSCFVLRYTKHPELLAIGNWLYQNHGQNIIQHHKYHRFEFYKKLKASKWTVQEKVENVAKFRRHEVAESKSVLEHIISLRNAPENQDEFRFRANFYKVLIPK